MYNVNMPLRSVGPIEYSSGPIHIGGTITLPLFGTWGDSITFTAIKQLVLNPIIRTIIVDYGYALIPNSGETRHIVQYNNCIIKAATVSCQPGSYAICTLDVGAQSTTNLTSFPYMHSMDYSVQAFGLVTFDKTKVSTLSGYGDVVSNNVSGWSFTITRDWNEYWGWNNTRASGDYNNNHVWDSIAPGNIKIEGNFNLLQYQLIANPNILRIDVGSNFNSSNFITFHKTLFSEMIPPVGGPNDRIIYPVKFICVGDGINGSDPSYGRNGLAS